MHRTVPPIPWRHVTDIALYGVSAAGVVAAVILIVATNPGAAGRLHLPLGVVLGAVAALVVLSAIVGISGSLDEIRRARR